MCSTKKTSSNKLLPIAIQINGIHNNNKENSGEFLSQIKEESQKQHPERVRQGREKTKVVGFARARES